VLIFEHRGIGPSHLRSARNRLQVISSVVKNGLQQADD
jgi:hypothetical protein